MLDKGLPRSWYFKQVMCLSIFRQKYRRCLFSCDNRTGGAVCVWLRWYIIHQLYFMPSLWSGSLQWKSFFLDSDKADWLIDQSPIVLNWSQNVIPSQYLFRLTAPYISLVWMWFGKQSFKVSRSKAHKEEWVKLKEEWRKQGGGIKFTPRLLCFLLSNVSVNYFNHEKSLFLQYSFIDVSFFSKNSI